MVPMDMLWAKFKYQNLTKPTLHCKNSSLMPPMDVFIAPIVVDDVILLSLTRTISARTILPRSRANTFKQNVGNFSTGPVAPGYSIDNTIFVDDTYPYRVLKGKGDRSSFADQPESRQKAIV